MKIRCPIPRVKRDSAVTYRLNISTMIAPRTNSFTLRRTINMSTHRDLCWRRSWREGCDGCYSFDFEVPESVIIAMNDTDLGKFTSISEISSSAINYRSVSHRFGNKGNQEDKSQLLAGARKAKKNWVDHAVEFLQYVIAVCFGRRACFREKLPT